MIARPTQEKQISFCCRPSFFFPLLYSTSFCRSDPQLLLAFLWILDLIHSACSGPHPFVCFCNNNSNLRLLTLTILSPPSPEFYCSSCPLLISLTYFSNSTVHLKNICYIFQYLQAIWSSILRHYNAQDSLYTMFSDYKNE